MAEVPPTRASLLVRLRDPRDGDAWRQFVSLYAPMVHGYARQQGLQDADAADLTQEVMSAVARSVGRLEYDPKRGAFRNWLFTVVRCKLSNWRAAPANRARGTGDSTTQALLQQCPAPDELEAAWEMEWQRHLVAWACEQVRLTVSESTWQAFWRTAVDAQAGKQVAQDLGLTLAAVYHARSRVLAHIKELVQVAQEG